MKALLLVVMVCAATTARAESPDLLEVYKREYAFLEGERVELDKRLGRVAAESAAEIARAEGALVTLDREAAALRLEGNQLEEELARLERELGATSERTVSLPDQLARAAESLGLGLDTGDNDLAPAAAIERVVSAAITRLEAQRRLTVAEGHFFLPDGTRTTGKIARLGELAAWGQTPQASGALAPAGGGELALWAEPAPESAIAMVSGVPPAVLDVVLWAKPDQAMKPRVARDFFAYTEAGGSLAWVIVGVGALAALAILLRAGLIGLSGGRRRVARELEQAVTGTIDPTLLEERVNALLLREGPRLDRLQTLITALAAIAPLLGLLGTVTGMIATFDVITEHGNSDPKMLSGGISEALITTEYGLVVAIPALLAGTLLSAWANKKKTRLEQLAVDRLVATLGEAAGLVTVAPIATRPRAASVAVTEPPLTARSEWVPSSTES